MQEMMRAMMGGAGDGEMAEMRHIDFRIARAEMMQQMASGMGGMGGMSGMFQSMMGGMGRGR
ncbi:hypothetical protein FRB99_000704 [Tulasnella sp. 403]|nr:hypothetical protein FRB99_000704 [Tulasnella sp. 403]